MGEDAVAIPELFATNEPGLYLILNISNGKFYIGSTVNLRKRRNSHFEDLRKRKHICRHLQKSFDIYGESSFKYIIFEKCDKSLLLEREQYWFDLLWDTSFLFNSFREAYAVHGKNHPLYGKTRSEEVKKKIRAKLMGRTHTHSDETKQKIRLKSLTYRHTEETKRKMSALKTKRIASSVLDDIIKEYREGASLEHLREKYHYGIDIIKRELLEKGVSLRGPYRKIEEKNLEAMIADYESNISLEDLQDKYGVSVPVIKRNLKQRGVFVYCRRRPKKNKEFHREKKERFKGCIVGDGMCSSRNSGRFCSTHWSQYYLGIIDINGVKIRDSKRGKKRYTYCIARDAGTGACSGILRGRFCVKHYNQYRTGIIDREGNKVRDFRSGPRYKKCLAEHLGGCKGRKRGRFCQRHADQYYAGVIDKDGNKIRNLTYGLKFSECLAKDSGTGPCAGKKAGRFCKRHHSQYVLGIIDRDGKKLREYRQKGIRYGSCKK
jgi:group I intron endonuclease